MNSLHFTCSCQVIQLDKCQVPAGLGGMFWHLMSDTSGNWYWYSDSLGKLILFECVFIYSVILPTTVIIWQLSYAKLQPRTCHTLEFCLKIYIQILGACWNLKSAWFSGLWEGGNRILGVEEDSSVLLGMFFHLCPTKAISRYWVSIYYL